MQRKIKILFAIDRMNIGGAPAVVFGQMRAMDKSKFEVHLATLYKSKKANFFSQIDFIPRENIKGFYLKNRSIFDFRTWRQISKFLKESNFDVIYTHLFLTNLIFRILAIRNKVPVILSFEHSQYYNKNRWQIIMDNFLSRWNSKIIVSTESVASFTASQEKIPISKFKVIPNPLTIPKKESVDLGSLRKEYSIPESAFIVLNIGRFSKEKGQKYLVEAAAQLLPKIPNLYVLIVGHGPLAKELAPQIEDLGIGQRCKLILEPERAKEFLYLANVFVLPSLREGQSIVTYEALMAGLPVISSNILSIREIIKEGENGLFVGAEDSKQIAIAIEKLYKDKELLDSMSKKAKESVAHYNSQENIRQLERLIEGSLGRVSLGKISFPSELVDVVLCPNDNGNFVLRGGFVECGKCSNKYKIENGILNLLSKGSLDNLAKDEIAERDKKAGNYDKKMKARYHKEVLPTLDMLGDVSGKTVVEYGAGTGRFTQHIAPGAALLLAIDFSKDSLFLLANKLSGSNNVGLVLADATTIKTKPNFFNCALSAQLFEHIPTGKSRNNFLANVKSTLKHGSIFVFSAYHQDLRRVLKKQRREGKHKNGIFFHYFTKRDLKKEVAKVFKNIELKFIDTHLPLEPRLGLAGFMGGYLSRIFSNIWGLRLFAHLLLVKAKKERLGYRYPSIIFKKWWIWFVDPLDIDGVDMVNFFSYNKVEASGFKRKEGLTSIIDLTKSKEDLWEGVRKSFIRKQIEKGKRIGVIVKRDTNFKSFTKVYRLFRKGKHIPRDSIKAFKENGTLLSAYFKGKYIAGGVFVENRDNIRAWSLASVRLNGLDGKTREIVGYANRIIIWEAMMHAKEKGIKKFDLGGINPESSKKEEQTLAEFKEAYGGERVKAYYYHKIYSPTLKWWINIRS